MSLVRQFMSQDPDDSTRRGEFDNMFKVPIVIDVAHHEVHEGDAFSAQVADSTESGMGDGETLVLAFKTPTGTKLCHMLMEFTTLTGGYLELYEGPTWDNSSGSQSPIYNRRRMTSMSSSILLENTTGTFAATDNLVLDPTTFVAGTSLHKHHGWGAKNRFSGQGRDVAEWILKADTTYAAFFMSTASSNKAQIFLNWYEHSSG